MPRLTQALVDAEWRHFAWQPGNTMEKFHEHLLERGFTAKTVDKVAVCTECGLAKINCTQVSNGVHWQDLNYTSATRWICANDLQYTFECDGGCGLQTQNLAQQADGNRYCIPCRDQQMFYCRTHGAYFPNREVGDHRHGADECCESPQKAFTVPYRGRPLANDTRVLIDDLIAHEVGAQGIEEIRRHLKTYAKSLGVVSHSDPDTRQYKMWMFAQRFDVGTEVTTKGGNFATRIKRAAYKDWSLKIRPDVLTEIGNIVARHSQGGPYHVEVTRDLNLPSSMFGNTNSCWWSDYKGSRCSLKNNGGFGVRVFADGHSSRVTGRCWVLPFRRDVDGALLPTFSTKGGLFFVFNGYGVLSNLSAVRLVAHMAGGRPFKQMSFTSNRENGMYINNNQGWMVADQAVLDRLPDHLGVELPQHSDLFTREEQAA